MKLELRVAGLCGTGMFLFLTYTSFFSTLHPLEMNSVNPSESILAGVLRVFQVAVPGALVSGFLGYHLGHCLAHPKAKKGGKKQKGKAGAAGQSSGAVGADEMFLEDVGSPAAGSVAALPNTDRIE